jgi:hypothetical protein
MTSVPLVETRLLRPLPRPVKPVPNETTDSYLHRLARANRLDDDALRAYAAGDPRKSIPIPVRRLAILSGQNEHALRRALPDLESGARRDHNRLVRYACRWCTAARAVTGWASVCLQPEDVVCLRHRRWMGDNRTGPEHQPSLAAHPEILRANQRHRRIIRARGPAAARSAYHHAGWVCDHWRRHRVHMHQFEQLLDRFHPPGVMIFEADPTVEACAYPQVIALTRILASPHWRELPFGSNIERARFQNEVRRTVAPHFTWTTLMFYGHRDPLVELFLDEAHVRSGSLPDLVRSPLFTS